MNGFPPGTAAGRSTVISAHGIPDIAATGFLSLVAACLVFARRDAARRERAQALFSLLAGDLFLAAFAGVASGSSSSAVVIGSGRP